jgi:hypothetical protein
MTLSPPSSSVLHRLEHAASSMRDLAIARAAIASRDLLIRTARRSGCSVYAITADDILEHLQALREPPLPSIPSNQPSTASRRSQRRTDDFEASLTLLGKLFNGASFEGE